METISQIKQEKIPKGWKLIELKEVGEFKTSSVDKLILSNEKIVNLVNYMDVYKNIHKEINNKINFMKVSASNKQINTSKIKKGDLLFNPSSETRSDIGMSAVVSEELPNTLYSYHLVRFRFNDENKFDFKYRKFLCNNYLILNEFTRICSGSTRMTLKISDFENTKILFPENIKEQEKIASILTSVDNSIEQTQKIIENNQKLKKALLQKLLKNENWNEYKLKDIFERVTRKNNKTSINVLTISAQQGLINQEKYFNKSVASKTLDNYTLLKKGEFAYNKSYSNGYPMGVIERLDNYENGVVTTLYICFKLKSNNFSSNFFKQLFYSGILNNEIKKIAKEGGRAHGLLNVTSNDFFNIEINIPNKIKEQEKIAKILQTMDNKMELEQKKKQTLEQMKKGLMQQLLTGKMRVEVQE